MIENDETLPWDFSITVAFGKSRIHLVRLFVVDKINWSFSIGWLEGETRHFSLIYFDSMNGQKRVDIFR